MTDDERQPTSGQSEPRPEKTAQMGNRMVPRPDAISERSVPAGIDE